MNYSIVKDETELQRFIDWLPELKDGQKFYWSLFARNKFKKTEGLKADKAQLKRGVCTKKDMISKFRKLEIKLGLYETDGVEINQESLALYITPNPRDMHKAGIKTIQELSRFLVDDRKIYNPEAVALNMVQVTGIKKYMDFDIDFKEEVPVGMATLLNWLEDKVNIESYINSIIKTRGGYHVLIDLEKISPEYKKTWYNNLTRNKSEYFDVTCNSDNMLPCPGCVQSDFIPKLI